MIAVLLIVLLVLGYFFARGRILAQFTDPVTRRNRSTLKKYLALLVGLLLVLFIWFALSLHA
jgi:hypothetical protein